MYMYNIHTRIAVALLYWTTNIEFVKIKSKDNLINFIRFMAALMLNPTL